MSRFLLSAVALVVPFVVMWGLTGFILLEWNVVAWTQDTRLFYVLASSLFSAWVVCGVNP